MGQNWVERNMRKPIRFIVMVVAVSLSATLLLMVGCKEREAPSCPYSASASRSANTIRLTWNSVENADFYVITDGYGSFLDEAYCTSYTDYYPSEGYNYYRVYSENQYGRSSTYASASCYYQGEGGGSGGGSGTAPSAPTGVSAEVSGSKIYVTWNSVSNATSYVVYWSTTDNNYTTTIGTTSNTYIYDNYPYENNYYKVKAVNEYGESVLSSSAYCHYSSGGGGGGGTAPSAPTGISATLTGSRVKITWNSVSNATEYVVDRSSTYYFGSFDRLGSTTNTYFYDDNPASGDNYYRVNAKNSYGQSYTTDHDYVYVSSGGGGGGGGGGTVYSPCPVHYTSHTATSTTITLRWSNPTTTGCGTPTSATLRVRNPDSGVYADLQTLSGTATTASFSYGMWADSDGYVYCGIITENSSGTSGGLPLVYNWKTNTWYGGNGKQYTDVMENEEFGFSNIKH